MRSLFVLLTLILVTQTSALAIEHASPTTIPSSGDSTGACCVAFGICFDGFTEQECLANGGEFEGIGTVCDELSCLGEPCTFCCLPDGRCVSLDCEECGDAGGYAWGPGGFGCEGDSCPAPYEACCFPDGTCIVQPFNTCPGSGGVPQGVGTICTTTECPSTSTSSGTWGWIKAIFR